MPAPAAPDSRPADAPVALVTGAGRGIGAATARVLAEQGWNLVLVDCCDSIPGINYPLATEQELQAVASEVGGRALVADVRDRGALAAAVDTARDTFGGLDAALAIAGVVGATGLLWDVPEAEWTALWDINVTGVLNLASVAVPCLLERPAPRRGRFVAVGSAAAEKATTRLAAYSASKAAVVGMVRGLAADLGNTGVSANVVQPGTTDTAILAPSAAAYGMPAIGFAGQHIDTRIIAPREIANVIAWLCSTDAAAITGAVIPADAGMAAR